MDPADTLNTFFLTPIVQFIQTMGLWCIVGAFFCVLLYVLISLIIRKITRPRPGEPAERRETKPKEPMTREEAKGQRGEDLIADVINKSVSGEFQLFRNVYVPNDDRTSEIDLLMVHETGLFVFESKNYGGWIYGSMEDLNWTQMFPNREKRSFYNPVRQNHNHIKALSQYLDIPERFFYSYVVFSDNCKLNKVPEDTRSTVITQTAQLKKRLKDTLSIFPPLYSAEEVRRISDRLIPLTDVSAEVKAKHVADIRNALESDICPFCGAELVLRHGKYGDFRGCSSYPKCKFKRKVEQ